MSHLSSFRTCQRHKYQIPFWQIGSRNSLNPGGIPFTVLQEYPSSGSRKGKERSWLSSSWIARPSPRIRLSAEAFAAATTASIRSCSDDGRVFHANVQWWNRRLLFIGSSSYAGDPRFVACTEVSTQQRAQLQRVQLETSILDVFWIFHGVLIHGQQCGCLKHILSSAIKHVELAKYLIKHYSKFV